jgi:hypothetical protein
MNLHRGGATQNFEQNLDTLPCGHNSQDEGSHADKGTISDNHFSPGREEVIDHNRVLCLKTLLQLLKYRVWHYWNPVPKMHESADSVGVPNFVKSLFNYTLNKDIAREQRLSDTYNASASHPFHSKLRMKNLQP